MGFHDSSTDWVLGGAALATGVAVITMAIFPLAIPLAVLTVAFALPLVLPLAALALAGGIILAAERAIRATARGFRGLTGGRRRAPADPRGDAPAVRGALRGC